jgi:hypothetical protein
MPDSLSSSSTLFPITDLVGNGILPAGLFDWLRERVEGFDALDFVDFTMEPAHAGLVFGVLIATPPEFRVQPAGPSGFALLLGESAFLRGRSTSDSAELFVQSAIRLRFPPEILRPVAGDDGTRAEFVELSLTPTLRIRWSDQAPTFNFTVAEGLTLSRAMIGNSGFVISADNVLLSLLPDAPLSEVVAAGFGEGFQGVYIERATVELPAWLNFATVSQLTFERCVVGTGGFSGLIQAPFNPTLVGTSAGRPRHFEGEGAGTLFGFSVGLQSISLGVRANHFSGSRFAGQILLPFINEPIALEARLSHEGNAVAITLTKDSPLTVNLPGATFQAEKLAAAGEISDRDGLRVSGSLTGGISLTFGNLLDFSAGSAAFDWAVGGDSSALSVEIDQLSFGPLGTLESAELNVEESASGRVVSLQARMRWEDLRARLSVPEFLPVPSADTVVAVDVRWSTDEDGQPVLVLRCVAEAVEFYLDFLEGLPPDLRPEFRNARLVFEATYDSESTFSNASTSDNLAGTFSAAIEMRLPPFSGPVEEYIHVETGDNEGWLEAKFTATLNQAGNANLSGTIGNPVSLAAQLPGLLQSDPPIQIAIESFGFEVGTGAVASAKFGLSGTFHLRPLTPPAELPFSQHLKQLLRGIEVSDLIGKATLTIEFQDQRAALTLDCQFENAEIEIDLFDVVGNLARGMSPAPDVEQPSQSIDLDLEVAFGLRGIKLQIGSLETAEAEAVSFEMVLGVRLGAIAVEGFLRLSDRELSIGVVEMFIPLSLPVFPLSQADLDLLRQNPADTGSRWTTTRLRNRLSELQRRIDQLAAATSRTEREELALRQGQKFLLRNLLNIYLKLNGAPNRATYQQGVEFVIGLLHTASSALHIDSRVQLKLANVRFLIPFTDPRNIALEGDASLVGFASSDPFKGLEDLPMTLGLSADQIYFLINSSGQPIPLPDFGRYPDGSVSLTKLTIGYGYTRNSLALAFAGELVLPPQLVADADMSRTLPAGIRLPLFTKLAFRLDIIPVPGPIPAVPAFDFNLDLRRPNSPALLDSQVCAPAWDGLQLIVPGIVRMGLKHLAISPLFGPLPCPNVKFDGDLMLGDENNGATLIADNMLVLLGVGTPAMPFPFLAAPNEPYFDNLCLNIRIAGFGLNFDLQRPFPTFNPIAIFEILGLLSDPMMQIDSDGALANTIRISLKDAHIVIPPFVRKLFPEAEAINRKDINLTINLGTVISATQWGVGAATATWQTLEEAGGNINRFINEVSSNPPEISPRALLAALPPELRKIRLGGSFAGFEASAVLLLIGPDDASRELQARDQAPPPPSNYRPSLGQAQTPEDLARFRPSLGSHPGAGRTFYPDDPTNNLFNGIEFRDFSASDLSDIPQTGAAGIVVGAYVKVFAAQRYRFLGYLFDDGSFGLISSLDIRPLRLSVAGIRFRLPLEFEGRLILQGRAKRDGFIGSIRASVFFDWTTIPGIAAIQVGSQNKPATLRLHSDGHFAIAGRASLNLFNGATIVRGSVDISHTHCFVNGNLHFSAGRIVDLALDCSGRLGPGLHFELGGSGSLTLMGQDVFNVKGVVTERGCALEARCNAKYWTIAGQHVPCSLDLDLHGAINLAQRSRPEIALEGKGFFSISELGMQITGRAGIESGQEGVNTFLEGSLVWQGREWLGGRVELGTSGVRLVGRTSFTLNLSPNNLFGIDLAQLFFKVDLEADVTFDAIEGSASFSLKGDWSLVAKLPYENGVGLTGQVFPLAAQHFNIMQSGSLEFELVHINEFVLVPFSGIQIPVPSITGTTPPTPVMFGIHHGSPAMSWGETTVVFLPPDMVTGHVEVPQSTVYLKYNAGFDVQNLGDLIPIPQPIDGDFVIAMVWKTGQLAIRVTRDNDSRDYSLATGLLIE